MRLRGRERPERERHALRRHNLAEFRPVKPGWDPCRPEASEPTLFDYDPAAWAAAKPLARRPGLARWTRGGIRGIDTGGDEPDTGQPERARASDAWVRGDDADALRRAAAAQLELIDRAEGARVRR